MNASRLDHRQAMELVDEAVVAELQGNAEQKREYLKQALELESRAANHYRDQFEVEPTRSILYRSAATIAMRLGESREAEKLASMGLAGNPPDGVAAELRAVLEQAQFTHHLLSKDIVLTSDKIDLTLVGSEVGYGYVMKDEFIRRVDAIQAMVVRSCEMEKQLPFREKGQPGSGVAKETTVGISPLRAASFGFTLWFGVNPSQPSFDELRNTATYVQRVLQILEAEAREDVAKVQELVPDPDYRSNLRRLVREVRPDGQRITTVNIGSSGAGVERTFALPRRQAAYGPATGPKGRSSLPKEFVGDLKAMDSRRATEFVFVVTAHGEEKVYVPAHAMDALGLYYRRPVRLTVRKEKGRWVYVDHEGIE